MLILAILPLLPAGIHVAQSGTRWVQMTLDLTERGPDSIARRRSHGLMQHACGPQAAIDGTLNFAYGLPKKCKGNHWDPRC